jgi:hypothetical protein
VLTAVVSRLEKTTEELEQERFVCSALTSTQENLYNTADQVRPVNYDSPLSR